MRSCQDKLHDAIQTGSLLLAQEALKEGATLDHMEFYPLLLACYQKTPFVAQAFLTQVLQNPTPSVVGALEDILRHAAGSSSGLPILWLVCGATKPQVCKQVLEKGEVLREALFFGNTPFVHELCQLYQVHEIASLLEHPLRKGLRDLYFEEALFNKHYYRLQLSDCLDCMFTSLPNDQKNSFLSHPSPTPLMQSYILKDSLNAELPCLENTKIKKM